MAREFWRYESGGYEWDDFYVYQHPRDIERYTVDTQGGCSCWSYSTPSDEDLGANNPLVKAEVLTAWQKFALDTTLSSQEHARGLDQLNEVLS